MTQYYGNKQNNRRYDYNCNGLWLYRETANNLPEIKPCGQQEGKTRRSLWATNWTSVHLAPISPQCLHVVTPVPTVVTSTNLGGHPCSPVVISATSVAPCTPVAPCTSVVTSATTVAPCNPPWLPVPTVVILVKTTTTNYSNELMHPLKLTLGGANTGVHKGSDYRGVQILHLVSPLHGFAPPRMFMYRVHPS